MLETKPEDFGFKKRDSEVVISKRIHQHQAVATTDIVGALLHLMHVLHNETGFVL